MSRFTIVGTLLLGACSEPQRHPAPTLVTPVLTTAAPAVLVAPDAAAHGPTALVCHQHGARPRFAATECYPDVAACEAAARADAAAVCAWVEQPICTTVKPGEQEPGARCFANEPRCRLFQADISSSADYSACAARR